MKIETIKSLIREQLEIENEMRREEWKQDELEIEIQERVESEFTYLIVRTFIRGMVEKHNTITLTSNGTYIMSTVGTTINEFIINCI